MSLISNSLRWTGASGRLSLSRLCITIHENGFRPYVNNLRICRRPTPQHRPFGSGLGDTMHRPSDFEKRVLVYNGAYPSIAEVPKEVTKAQMLRAKDWFRIRVNIGMGIATVFACIGLVYSGKKAAREGKNVTQQNLEMHRQYQEKITTPRNDKDS